MPNALTLAALTNAMRDATALRAVLTLQPAGGPGAKVFPPTYISDDNKAFGDTKYAIEQRKINGGIVDCVLLDSVASQANRMEEALQDRWEDGELDFPLVVSDFTEADESLEARVGSISTLQAPHRIHDAIFRDSVDDSGTLFRYTDVGQRITHATKRDATALYTFCPTALVFGAWDSAGPKGGLGSKFPRALSSEVVGIGMVAGSKVGGRLDPLGIIKKAGPVYEHDGSDRWGMDKPSKGKAKELNPSDINHGNVAPSRDLEAGGVTFDHALQTTVLSLPALRRLRFRTAPDGSTLQNRADAQLRARTALAALALAGLVSAYEEGHDLRSGTLLIADGPLELEVVGRTGEVTGTFSLDSTQAASLLADASNAAATAGMPWQREPMPALKPAPKLVALLKKSQQLEATTPVADEEA